ncbi:MAG: glycosyltransferase family 4 protein [Vicinamibacterales bacterium]
MRIAVDARELCGKPTGVGRYLAELLREWSDGPAARHEWVLYAHEPPVVPPAFAGVVELLPGAGGTRWEQWDLGRRLRARRPDVLFAPAYTAPLVAPCPVALTIHDVSFFALPDEFRLREGMRRRLLTRLSARRARVVLTDSAFSRGEIVRRLGTPAARVRAIPLGMHVPAPPPARGREPMVLFVGSILPRRHVDLLVDVFVSRVLPAVPDARLDIVGANRLPPHLRVDRGLTDAPPGVRERVRFRDYVDDTTLKDLYARASVFAFPSAYEGFGLTPLEALAAGVPPVVFDTGIAREIYGDAAWYVPYPDGSEEGLAQALIALLTDEAARARPLAAAAGVLGRYRWADTAARTLQAIEEAARA